MTDELPFIISKTIGGEEREKNHTDAWLKLDCCHGDDAPPNTLSGTGVKRGKVEQNEKRRLREMEHRLNLVTE